MKPVYQINPTGCLPACLASLLEVPVESVPHLHDKLWAENLPWDVEYGKWLDSHGYKLRKHDRPPQDAHLTILAYDTRWTNGVPLGHAVIGRGDCIIHDPLDDHRVNPPVAYRLYYSLEEDPGRSPTGRLAHD